MAHIAEQAAAFLLGDGWKYQPCGDQYEKVIVGWAPAGPDHGYRGRSAPGLARGIKK